MKLSGECMALYNAIQRCTNPNHPSWINYGGRGITVYSPWQGRGGAKLFLRNIGPRPSPKHTLERINNNGNYEPGNVRWATWLEQARNKRSNSQLAFSDKTQCVTAWAEEVGLTEKALRTRLARGWSTRRALTTPPTSRLEAIITLIEYNGESYSIAEWARRYGLKYRTLHNRLSNNWSIQAALSTPVA